MATLTHQCPHCLTEHIALRIRAATAHTFDQYLMMTCPKCDKPSCAHARNRGNSNASVSEFIEHDVDVTDLVWLKSFWPEIPKPAIPDHAPEPVNRALLQAERNFTIEGNEEAAGMMYRKALDVGLTVVASEVKGSLNVRINKLAEQHVITPALAEWAHQIRILGNESAHDADAPTREDITSLRNFTNLVMQYLFTLPKMVEMRKADNNAGE